MDNKFNVIKEFLEREDYVIVETDQECGVIAVRYQMNIIHICAEAQDDFVSMVLPGLDELTEDTALQVLMRCIGMASQQKVVKAYPISSENVVISYEFHFDSADQLFFQLTKGFDSLIAAKIQYNRLIDEVD